MPRRISTSQLRSKLRQLQSKQRQAVSKYNQQVRRRNQNLKRAVDKYNSGVRKHNARVRSNRQKIIAELRRLQSQTTTVRYRTLRSSAISLNTSYEHLDADGRQFENRSYGAEFLDLSEKEIANSLSLSNALEGDPEDLYTEGFDTTPLVSSEIESELTSISSDLLDRWQGALFSLNPRNPDAARHFCTSAREVFVQILNQYAPDALVIRNHQDCPRTETGEPTRRAKIGYMLHSAGLDSSSSVDFVDEDVSDILTLFRVFNEGTHGTSGKFGLTQLISIKTRVETGICYLASIARASL